MRGKGLSGVGKPLEGASPPPLRKRKPANGGGTCDILPYLSRYFHEDLMVYNQENHALNHAHSFNFFL